MLSIFVLHILVQEVLSNFGALDEVFDGRLFHFFVVLVLNLLVIAKNFHTVVVLTGTLAGAFARLNVLVSIGQHVLVDSFGHFTHHSIVPFETTVDREIKPNALAVPVSNTDHECIVVIEVSELHWVGSKEEVRTVVATRLRAVRHCIPVLLVLVIVGHLSPEVLVERPVVRGVVLSIGIGVGRLFVPVLGVLLITSLPPKVRASSVGLVILIVVTVLHVLTLVRSEDGGSFFVHARIDSKVGHELFPVVGSHVIPVVLGQINGGIFETVQLAVLAVPVVEFSIHDFLLEVRLVPCLVDRDSTLISKVNLLFHLASK